MDPEFDEEDQPTSTETVTEDAHEADADEQEENPKVEID